MPEDKRVHALIRRQGELESNRGVWQGQWEDLRQLVRPNVTKFMAGNSGEQTKGDERRLAIYDSTAPWAAEQLAAGLHSFLTNPTDLWFFITVQDDARLSLQARQWLEFVTKRMYREFSRPVVGLDASLHEVYLDLVTFGTGILYQDWNAKEKHLIFRTFSLADNYIDEDDNERIDSNFRIVNLTTSQAVKMFGEDNLPSKMLENHDHNKRWKFIHAVFPREERDLNKITNTNLPFASIWVCQELKEIVKESGFHEFPFHIPRWSKLTEERYGRGPGITALPDIKMVNTMSKTLVKAAQKIVDPPLMVPDDGFLLPIKVSPASLNFYTPGSDPLVPLETKGNIPIGQEMIAQRQDSIVKAFFLDWLFREKKKERQTTTEIIDDREEMLRQLAPILGRLQGELLGPMIRRSYNILQRHGAFPPPPAELAARGLKVSYVSPASVAQRGIKAMNISRYLQEVTALASVDPGVLDTVNMDAAATEIAELRSVSPAILRDPQEVAQLRQQRQEQQQQQQQMMAARESAAATKDFAAAQELSRR